MGDTREYPNPGHSPERREPFSSGCIRAGEVGLLGARWRSGPARGSKVPVASAWPKGNARRRRGGIHGFGGSLRGRPGQSGVLERRTAGGIGTAVARPGPASLIGAAAAWFSKAAHTGPSSKNDIADQGKAQSAPFVVRSIPGSMPKQRTRILILVNPRRRQPTVS